ncbi:response regulator transcription factor [Herbiconiux sp. CPCC 203407]|uniref:Response regulator transcription factor n=1 Tax=Herbiconiux oxytropis TaxID=2970915 RepID=A0AA41XEJ1_9MICO|nr:response regulator transcription factor [Herbiconiux oxytropis]MCS5721629.1 response regulator transcription factor [Herbiconiux oxytropis]MCS5726744.1 response regulator transcription factor [Herbiconiux oxytropis]
MTDGTESIRVLVVDDHPIVRSGIVALLESADGIEVAGEAADGLTAIERAAELRPDVVLMDLRLPGLGGEQATARIIERDPGIRVLVLTTYETDENILESIEAGASGYLLKAAPEEEILAGVRSVAAGHTVLAPSIATKLVERMRSAPASRPSLSARELQVLTQVAAGRSNPEIGRALFIGEATVKTHLQHIFEKLEVSDRTRAVTKAMELRLI